MDGWIQKWDNFEKKSDFPEYVGQILQNTVQLLCWDHMLELIDSGRMKNLVFSGIVKIPAEMVGL